MCPYSGEFFVRKGALEKLIKRGAIIEKSALPRKGRRFLTCVFGW
jgi:hypothetical protein